MNEHECPMSGDNEAKLDAEIAAFLSEMRKRRVAVALVLAAECGCMATAANVDRALVGAMLHNAKEKHAAMAREGSGLN